MQSAHDRARLLQRYGAAVDGVPSAVLRCAAGLAILAVVAAGPWVIVTAGGAGAEETPALHDAARSGAEAPPDVVPVQPIADSPA